MPLTKAAAEKELRALARADAARWRRLPALFGSAEAVSAAEGLLGARVPDPVRWGAAMVYLRGGASPEPLVPLLRHDLAVLRVKAAGGLLARADARGFPVLLAELESAAWRSAASELVRWTADTSMGPPLDADMGQRAAAAAAWRAWWAANAQRVRFVDGRWSVA